MKKGIALAWGGIIAICLVATFVVIYMLQSGPVQVAEATNAGKIITFANDAELYRKTITISAPYVLEHSAYRLGQTGIKQTTWDETKPTLEKIETELSNQINQDIQNMDGLMTGGNLDVIFDNTQLEITQQPNAGFNVEGIKVLTVHNPNLDAISKVDIDFTQIVPSSYFRLTGKGRDIIDEEHYKIKDEWFTDHGDGTFSVTSHIVECDSITGSNIDIIGSYGHADIQNIVKNSILCGYENYGGIGTYTNNRLDQIKFRIDSILSSLNSDLSLGTMQVIITKGDVTNNVNRFTIPIKATITDTSSSVYVSDLEGGGTDTLKLIFNFKTIITDLKYYDLEPTRITQLGVDAPVSIRFTVKNHGNLRANNVNYRMYLGNANLCEGTIDHISANGEARFDACKTIPAAGVVKIIVDPANTFSESNENNNQMSKGIAINPPST